MAQPTSPISRSSIQRFGCECACSPATLLSYGIFRQPFLERLGNFRIDDAMVIFVTRMRHAPELVQQVDAGAVAGGQAEPGANHWVERQHLVDQAQQAVDTLAVERRNAGRASDILVL